MTTYLPVCHASPVPFRIVMLNMHSKYRLQSDFCEIEVEFNFAKLSSTSIEVELKLAKLRSTSIEVELNLAKLTSTSKFTSTSIEVELNLAKLTSTSIEVEPVGG